MMIGARMAVWAKSGRDDGGLPDGASYVEWVMPNDSCAFLCDYLWDNTQIVTVKAYGQFAFGFSHDGANSTLNWKGMRSGSIYWHDWSGRKADFHSDGFWEFRYDASRGYWVDGESKYTFTSTTVPKISNTSKNEPFNCSNNQGNNSGSRYKGLSKAQIVSYENGNGGSFYWVAAKDQNGNACYWDLISKSFVRPVSVYGGVVAGATCGESIGRIVPKFVSF